MASGAKESNGVWQHRGGTVKVLTNGTFRWDLGDAGGPAASLYAAKNEIDKTFRAAEKAKSIKISIPVLTVVSGEVKSITITGIHSTRGELLTSPKIERSTEWGQRDDSDDKEFYADTPAIRKMLEDRTAAKKRLVDLAYPLNSARVRSPGIYHGIAEAAKELVKEAADSAKAHEGMKRE